MRCKHPKPVYLVKPVPHVFGFMPMGWQWCKQCGATRMVHSLHNGEPYCPGPRYAWRYPKEAAK